jgi:hypothetical protein
MSGGGAICGSPSDQPGNEIAVRVTSADATVLSPYFATLTHDRVADEQGKLGPPPWRRRTTSADTSS